MVQRKNWGVVKEKLVPLSSSDLSDLCYFFDLPISGNISDKIERIRFCNYNNDYLLYKINFLNLAQYLDDVFLSEDLKTILQDYDLYNPSRKWEKLIEDLFGVKSALELTTEEADAFIDKLNSMDDIPF